MAYEAYLKLAGITGNSPRKQWIGYLAVTSFNWSLEKPDDRFEGGGGAAVAAAAEDQLTISDFSFVVEAGKHTPELVAAMSKGEPITNGDLFFIRVDQKTGAEVAFMKFRLVDSMITSFQESEGSLGTTELDTFTLSWGRLEVEHLDGITAVIDRRP